MKTRWMRWALAAVTLVAAACGTTVATPDHTGSAGGAGAPAVCTPGATQACYSGPKATEGRGTCKPGTQTCGADGMSWGPCVGEVLPTTDLCATLEDEDCDGKLPTCFGDLELAARYGDGADQQGLAVAGGVSGDVVLAGSFQGTIDFGSGPLVSAGGTDVVVVVLDYHGTVVWARRFGDEADQVATGVAVDEVGNVVVTGRFAGSIDFGGGPLTSAGGDDVFLVKLDSNGNELWSQRFGDAEAQSGTGVATIGDDVVLVGWFGGAIDLGDGPHTAAGSSSAFAARFDPHGAVVWSRGFVGPGESRAHAVAIGYEGGAVVVGEFTSTIDAGLGPMVSNGGTDAFVVKLDYYGAPEFCKGYGDADSQAAYGVAVNLSDAVAVVGGFSGTIDFGGSPHVSAGGRDAFVVKYNFLGNYQWSRAYGGAGDQVARSVTRRAGGDFLATGDMEGAVDFGGGLLTSAGASDVFLLRFDPAGKHVMSARFGDPGAQVGAAIAVDSYNDPLVTGFMTGTVDFGSGPLTCAGGTDIFLARFEPN